MYTRVENPHNQMDARDLFQRAGLLYEVEKRRLGYLDDDGNFVPSNIKRNHTLKVKGSPTEFDGVSPKWEIYQPTELVDWVEQTVSKFGLIPYAAGSFEGGDDAGKIGWFQARLPGEHTLFKGGDRYDPLLTITNQQKYGTTWGGGFSAIRIICRNTFHAADGTLQIRLNHRAVFDAEAVGEQLQHIAAQWIGYKEKMQYLASRRIEGPKLTTGKAIVEYFQQIFPSTDKDKPSRATNLAIGAIFEQPGAKVGEGSWYQAFNAVTYVTDHLLHTKNKNKRDLSAQYGEGARRKVEALKLALNMAAKSPEMA